MSCLRVFEGGVQCRRKRALLWAVIYHSQCSQAHKYFSLFGQSLKAQFELWPRLFNMSSLIARLRRLCSSLSKVDPQKPTKQLATAASHVIKFLAAQPYFAGSNYSVWPKAQVQEQDGTLVHCVLKMLEEKKTRLDVIDFFRQMFDPKRGVVLPAAYSGQQRIKRGSSFVKKFSFLPNRVVTPLVFNILTVYDHKHLLYGDSGISKTSNIVFYCYLARLITLHDFSHDGRSDFPDINRVIYLSYYEQGQQDQIVETLLEQFPFQINQPSFMNLRKSIREQFKKKGLQGRVVLDQFNSLAKLAYQFNSNATTSTNLQQLKLQREKTKAQINLWMNAAKKIFDHSPVLYNSSLNIQLEVLGRQTPKRIAFNLNHHTPIPKVQISALHDFVDQLKTPIYEIEGRQQKINREWVDCILFEVLKKNSIEQGVLEQVRELCMKEVDNELLSVLTPLEIYNDFKNIQLPPSTAEEIKEILFKKLKDNFQQAKTRKKEQLEIYLEKRRICELALLTLKYRTYLQQQQDPKKAQWITVPQQLTKAAMELDKNLFLVKKQKGKVCFRSVIPAEQFLQRTANVQAQLYTDLNQKETTSICLQLGRHDHGFTGKMVEGYLLYYFKRHARVRFQLLIDAKQKQFKTGKQGLFKFVQFNDQLPFKQRFQQLFQLAERKGEQIEKGEYFVGLPVDKKGNHSTTSKSIDFLLVRMNEAGKYQFTSVDIKVSSKRTSILGCANDASALIDKQKDQSIAVWQHYIVYVGSRGLYQLDQNKVDNVKLADIRKLANSLRLNGQIEKRLRLWLNLLQN